MKTITSSHDRSSFVDVELDLGKLHLFGFAIIEIEPDLFDIKLLCDKLMCF